MDEQEKQNQQNEEYMEHPDYTSEIEALIHSDISPAEKKERLLEYHENDIALTLERLTPEERQRLYQLLGAEEVSEVFAYLDDPSPYLAELDVTKAALIVEKMDADDAVDILDNLDEEQKKEIIAHLDEESRRDIDMIQSYDDDEIGSKMTTNYIAIRHDLSIKQAMRSLIDQAAENDNLSTIYVLNDDETFHGAISLQDLIIAREGTDLESLVTVSYPYVYAHETVSECIEELKDYSEDSIPVLDEAKKLIGVITSQDLVEVVDEELGEDYAKLAGLSAEEDLHEPLQDSLKKRIPWLIVLMLLGLVVSSVVGVFEPVVAQLTMVIAFQSMILDMAGNAGTQSLAVTIRVLMDENLTGGEKFRLVLKEARIGMTSGLILGVISTLVAGLFIWLFKGYTPFFSFAVSGCIGVALMTAMTISNMTGTVIPIFFKKLNVDPAVASGPLITTVTDLVAIVTYYGLSWLLLINYLHLQG